LLLGYASGGSGVVIAWVLSLIGGSITILLSFHRRNKIPLSEMFPKDYLFVGLSSIAGFSVSLFAYRNLSSNFSLMSITGIVILTIIIFPAFPLWQHPMRKRLLDMRLARLAG
jgi:hypothetical protein